MDMLQENKKLIVITSSLLFLIFSSCNKKIGPCNIENAISPRITLDGFKKSELTKLHINRTNSSHLLKINSNGTYLKITPFLFTELKKNEISFIFNDSLSYLMSNIKIQSEKRRTMVREMSDCNLVSFKVNDSIYFHHQKLTIYR